jgi:hypothetical protein
MRLTDFSRATGSSGFSGPSGFSGFSSASGYSGFSGIGTSGYSGFSGTGTSGYSGFSGTSGYSGFTGYSGTSGYSGFTGYSGYTGYSGVTGYSGFSGTGVRTLNFIIDGGGSVLTTGSKGFCPIDTAYTISQWTIVGSPSGSCVVDVKRATYTNFPTTASIVGGSGNKPTLSSAQKNQATPTSWTSTSIAAGDILEFNVDSATTVTRVTVSLELTP